LIYSLPFVLKYLSNFKCEYPGAFWTDENYKNGVVEFGMRDHLEMTFGAGRWLK
jgi:hypothetical protein